MKTILGILAAGGLALGAVAGCTTTASDERLAAVEAELKALRAEIATLKAQSTPTPPAAAPSTVPRTAPGRLPGMAADPEMLERLRTLNAVQGDADLRKDLTSLGGKLDETKKAVEDLKGEVVRLKEQVDKPKAK